MKYKLLELHNSITAIMNIHSEFVKRLEESGRYTYCEGEINSDLFEAAAILTAIYIGAEPRFDMSESG